MRDVRFTPNSGHPAGRLRCPLSANSLICHRNKQRLYQSPSSVATSSDCGSVYCLGPTVPVFLRRDDFTHPDTVLPVLGFE